MRKLLDMMHAQLASGNDAVLVTVIASSGSTPRGEGARMLMTGAGRICGTIGGGAVEFRSEQMAAQMLQERHSATHDFVLTKNDVDDLGMVCGGDVTVYCQYIPGGDAGTIALLEEAERRIAASDDLWLVNEISGQGALGLYSKDQGFQFLDVPEEAKASLLAHPRAVSAGGRTFYMEQIATSSTVYVFGCGHVGQALVPALAAVDFRCVALDDRPLFADRRFFPDAADVKVIDFDRISDYVAIGPNDYVVVMTRGHSFDLVVQAQMLKTPCCYLGVIGSRRKKAAVFKALLDMGFGDDDLERITTPIGLDIGAESPAEIAVSIAAQMIEVRAGRRKES